MQSLRKNFQLSVKLAFALDLAHERGGGVSGVQGDLQKSRQLSKPQETASGGQKERRVSEMREEILQSNAFAATSNLAFDGEELCLQGRGMHVELQICESFFVIFW